MSGFFYGFETFAVENSSSGTSLWPALRPDIKETD